jgi:porin
MPGWCDAQSTAPSALLPETSPVPEHSIEDLNLVGAAVTMPLISDTVLGVESGFRHALFSEGILFRANILPRISTNLLDPPVPANQQAYIGQRPTSITGVNPILTADLRQLHLQDAQLNIGFGWRWTNWNPAGPKTLALSSLYFYKMWRDREFEIKAGYITNDTEFVGMQVGGAIATGALGVYAVLPFQVGMSYFPLTAPSFNVRVRGPGFTYLKIGAQRSLDAAGGPATEQRNQTGFRFVPKGNGLLLINEVGYQRPSGASAHYAWLRAGYLHNSTPYTDKVTGKKESGNECLYVLMDYQIHASPSQGAGRGLYAGGTMMTAPSRFNAYDRYFEGRLYQRAPFRSRPDDLLSLVGAYSGYSKYVTANLAAEGKSVWHSSRSMTASYSAHVSRGNYLTIALGYVRGAAITPRVADTLTFTATWGLYL